MTDERYNGWTNYETWNVALRLGAVYLYWQAATLDAWTDAADDPPFTRSEVARRSLADRLRDEVTDGSPLADGASMYTDLLGAALQNVSWGEIADNWLEGHGQADGYEPVTTTLPG